jgi:hypothetical protein
MAAQAESAVDAKEPRWSPWLSAAQDLLAAVSGPANGLADVKDRRYARSIVAVGSPTPTISVEPPPPNGSCHEGAGCPERPLQGDS